MRIVSNPTPTPGQAPASKPLKIVIGGQLALHWLRGELQISPPSKRRRESTSGERNKRHANGNGANTLSDDAVRHFVVEAGVGRVQRAIKELTEPRLPLTVEAVS